MKSTITEDFTGDKLNRVIETIDEMLAKMEKSENET
jgi:hypothetical protein